MSRRLSPEEVSLLDVVIVSLATALAHYEEGNYEGVHNSLEVYKTAVPGKGTIINVIYETSDMRGSKPLVLQSSVSGLDRRINIMFKAIEQGKSIGDKIYSAHSLSNILSLFMFLIVYVRELNNRDVTSVSLISLIDYNGKLGVELLGRDGKQAVLQLVIEEGVPKGKSDFWVLCTQEGILRATDRFMGKN